MTRTTFAIPALLATLLCSGMVMAQTAAPAKAKPAAKKAAPKKAVVTPAAKPLPAASAEQLEAADRTLIGIYACEFDQKIDIEKSAKAPGYVEVKFKNSLYTMKPVLSSTGALRLEDVTGRTLMLQIANKSMLMDTKIGQRMVDNCVHPEQAKFNAART
jgi:hypothetical protein